MLASNPYLLIVLMLAIAGAFGYGVKVGVDREVARQARTEEIVARVADAAQKSAAAEIARIEIKHTTIQKRAEVILRDVPVYSECKNTPEIQELLNAARSNGGAVGVGSGHP